MAPALPLTPARGSWPLKGPNQGPKQRRVLAPVSFSQQKQGQQQQHHTATQLGHSFGAPSGNSNSNRNRSAAAQQPALAVWLWHNTFKYRTSLAMGMVQRTYRSGASHQRTVIRTMCHMRAASTRSGRGENTLCCDWHLVAQLSHDPALCCCRLQPLVSYGMLEEAVGVLATHLRLDGPEKQEHVEKMVQLFRAPAAVRMPFPAQHVLTHQCSSSAQHGTAHRHAHACCLCIGVVQLAKTGLAQRQEHRGQAGSPKRALPGRRSDACWPHNCRKA